MRRLRGGHLTQMPQSESVRPKSQAPQSRIMPGARLDQGKHFEIMGFCSVRQAFPIDYRENFNSGVHAYR